MGKDEIGFKVFVAIFNVAIITLVILGAWIIGKVLLALPCILAFYFARVVIEKNGNRALHFMSNSLCLVVSSCICVFAIHFSLPLGTSLISVIGSATLCAMATWYVGEGNYAIATLNTLPRRENWRTLNETDLNELGFTERQKAILGAIKKGIKGEQQIDYILDLGFDYSGSTQDREYKEIKQKLNIKNFK